jgi:outer membrane receptor protein involved in Fe transport
VTVDIDGTLSMRGSSNVTILVDGKPSGLSGLSSSAILEQIPASSIERIEVITNPSAKYDPDGMSGIINIIMKKKKEKGYNGMISVTTGTGNKYNGSVNMNFRREKLNLFGSYDMRQNKRKGNSHFQRQTIFNDTLTFLDTYENSSNNGLSNNIRGGFDYLFNDFNSVTLSLFTNVSYGNDDEYGKSAELDSIMQPYSYYDNFNKERSNDKSSDYNLNYRKTYEKKGKEWTIDAIYSSSASNEHNYITTQFYDSQHIPVSDLPLLRHTLTDETSNVFTIQSDYINPLSEKSRLEAGFKSIIRAIDSDYKCDSFVYNGFNKWQYDSLQSNLFVYNEQLHSAYGIFSGSVTNLEYQAGLRFEQAFTRSSQKTSNENFTNDYFNVFPTLHLSYKIKNNNSLQLSYSRRINRPSAHHLNPFVDKSMVSVYHFGNPRLTPEYVNTYEAGYLKYWDKTSLNTTAFYRQINDIIQRYVYLVQINDSTQIQYATEKNMSRGISYGLEVVLQQDIFKWWNINLNYSYFRNKIEGDADGTALTNSNYTWNTKLNSSMTVWKNLDIQLIGNYRAPMVNIQGVMQAMYNVDVALKKDFFRGNMSVSIRASDIFNTQQFNMHRTGEGLIIDMKRKRESRIVYIGLTYRINGGIKQKEKKRQEGEGQEEMDF